MCIILYCLVLRIESFQLFLTIITRRMRPMRMQILPSREAYLNLFNLIV
jgi:hypothetical protein